MAALYLIGYIVAVSLLIQFTTGWDRDKLPVILVILGVAFVGWFIVLGMIIEGQHRKSGISVSGSGMKTGFQFFGSWLLYMLVLIVAAGILVLLKWLLTGK